MNFLSPLLLILGMGAAVPLLLHLLRRRTGARIEFPAARYLARAEREHSRQLKLKNLLLMLLRVVAIVAIALAAARPVSRLVPTGGTHAPAAVAIVLDNSLSTSVIVDGRSVLDDLKGAAASAINRLSAADRAWLVTADGAVQGGSPAALRAALARVTALGGAGDPPAAAARAAALVSNAAHVTAGDAVVGVLTDGQATTWLPGAAQTDLAAARGVVYQPGAPPPSNHAVLLAEARPLRWTPRGEIMARFSGIADSATYRIDLGTRTLARGTVAGESMIAVHAAPGERGWVGGSVELEPDELRADDIRHFAVWIGQPPAVGVDSAAGPFVAGALATLVSTGRASPGRDDAVAVVPADQLTRLPALIMAPSDPVRVGAANRALERAGVPWRLGAMRTGGEERVIGIVTGGDSAHDDPGITVAQRYPLAANGVAPRDTLARVSDQPWIVAGPGYVLVASPIDPRATTFPVRASFVPWLADVIAQRLGGGSGGDVIRAVPGASVPRPEGVDAIEAQDGTVRPVTGETIAVPSASGVYFLRARGTRAGAIVADGDPKESDLRRLTAKELADRFKSRVRPVRRVYGDSSAWSDEVFAGNGSRSVLAPLLVLALVALLAESVLARGRPRSTGAGAPAVRRAA